MSDLSEDPQEYLKRMDDDRVVVLPGDRELFVDIDSEEGLDTLKTQLHTMRLNGIHAEITRTTPSRTEGHYHVVVELMLCALDPTMRIALQACLGSDRKRELLSALRIIFDTGRAPTVFFEEAAIGETETAD
jgi:hypothetical protein